jgi:hypothetical protein
MTTPDTSVEETASFDYDPETEEDWLDQPEELPRRHRRKLLAPIPVALLAVLLLAGGFFAGVKVEKGQSSTSSSGGLPAGLAAPRSAAGAGSGTSASASRSSGAGAAFPATGGTGFPGSGGGSGGLTTGEVSYVSGNTLYVTSSQGDTVKVSAPKGTKVSKTVSTSVHSIHPGDTVIVTGTAGKSGSVTAGSISISSTGSGTGGAGSTRSSGAGATQQLFGNG